MSKSSPEATRAKHKFVRDTANSILNQISESVDNNKTLDLFDKLLKCMGNNYDDLKKHIFFYDVFSKYVAKYQYNLQIIETCYHDNSPNTQFQRGHFLPISVKPKFSFHTTQLLLCILAQKGYLFSIGHFKQIDGKTFVFPSIFDYSLQQAFRKGTIFLKHNLMMLISPKFASAIEISQEPKKDDLQFKLGIFISLLNIDRTDLYKPILRLIAEKDVHESIIELLNNKEFYDATHTIIFRDFSQQKFSSDSLLSLSHLSLHYPTDSFKSRASLAILHCLHPKAHITADNLLFTIDELYKRGYSQNRIITFMAELVSFHYDPKETENIIIDLICTSRLPLQDSIISIFKLNLAIALFNKNQKFYKEQYAEDAKSFEFHNFLQILYQNAKNLVILNSENYQTENGETIESLINDGIEFIDNKNTIFNDPELVDVTKLGYMATLYTKAISDNNVVDQPNFSIKSEQIFTKIEQGFKEIDDLLMKGVASPAKLKSIKEFYDFTMKDQLISNSNFGYNAKCYFAFNYFKYANLLAVEIDPESVRELYYFHIQYALTNKDELKLDDGTAKLVFKINKKVSLAQAHKDKEENRNNMKMEDELIR